MPKEITPEHILELAKQLRQNQTDAEKLVWYLLRNRQLANAKFRRQHPIEGYIADFYCHEHKLIIELDGGQHFTEEGIKKDAQRTARLNALGIQVLRFDNRQVFTQTEAVLQMIYDKLQNPHPEALRFPHPSPLPKGEGAKSTHSETSTVSSPLPLGEGQGEGLLSKKNLMGLGYEC
ncbi:MAG: hypothetical protein RL497_19 [Pseudomonadota bacterium]|jgi:type I restriction enzyme M protein